jgi:hypothetical protein
MKKSTILLLIIGLTVPAHAMQKDLERVAQQVAQEKLDVIRHANEANPSVTIHGTITRLHDLVQQGLDKRGAIPRKRERSPRSLTQEDWDEVFKGITSDDSCENAEKCDNMPH